ncbi:HD domain-containing phosphohydrolase [Algisphaera agarilytica]|uniref:Response regulator RpfG family c-di-GMP phosphodiesterase n=1 Tax=Algisphaera agarilytica TaxID=1385975 RepID=A0A7X0H457_9BACT|nr:HD domain-containing phosphohydrolase [Algisphaera agarilytica]MBB6428952.1 response regulator RpfG family c-di-GMP phosphodiesterase [Algisphaera agarilytica]
MTRILFVDDEINVLNGFRRTLGTKYNCIFAQGAAEALSELCQTPEVGVVVTDMRMPGMDGITFINQARKITPHTVFIMLTGNADVETATDAVNRGEIFRFLAKPCPPDVLQPAIDAAMHRYLLTSAEQTLLRKTLTGSVRLLTEMLWLAKPELAEHNGRVRRTVRQLVQQMELHDPWAHEVAALLSQIGRFTLPDHLTNASASSLENEADLQLLNSHPARAAQMLRHIPRLELPGKIIEHEFDATEPGGKPAEAIDEQIPLWGACVLRVALAFDAIYSENPNEIEARQAVYDQLHDACPLTTKALIEMPTTECEDSPAQLRVLNTDQLQPGMFSAAPITLCDGRVLLGRGRELTQPLILQLQVHVEHGLLAEPLDILVPEAANDDDGDGDDDQAQAA